MQHRCCKIRSTESTIRHAHRSKRDHHRLASEDRAQGVGSDDNGEEAHPGGKGLDHEPDEQVADENLRQRPVSSFTEMKRQLRPHQGKSDRLDCRSETKRVSSRPKRQFMARVSSHDDDRLESHEDR